MAVFQYYLSLFLIFQGVSILYYTYEHIRTFNKVFPVRTHYETICSARRHVQVNLILRISCLLHSGAVVVDHFTAAFLCVRDCFEPGGWHVSFVYAIKHVVHRIYVGDVEFQYIDAIFRIVYSDGMKSPFRVSKADQV
eukprot:snap_masked-scaffold_16-processed-gene-5.24-mRNA-1 protein AED:1.00 eAED:1.00 QI:0/0/0/0/1/1/3/0/137